MNLYNFKTFFMNFSRSINILNIIKSNKTFFSQHYCVYLKHYSSISIGLWVTDRYKIIDYNRVDKLITFGFINYGEVDSFIFHWYSSVNSFIDHTLRADELADMYLYNYNKRDSILYDILYIFIDTMLSNCKYVESKYNLI